MATRARFWPCGLRVANSGPSESTRSRTRPPRRVPPACAAGSHRAVRATAEQVSHYQQVERPLGILPFAQKSYHRQPSAGQAGRHLAGRTLRMVGGAHNADFDLLLEPNPERAKVRDCRKINKTSGWSARVDEWPPRHVGFLSAQVLSGSPALSHACPEAPCGRTNRAKPIHCPFAAPFTAARRTPP